jgi:hypothetical protein
MKKGFVHAALCALTLAVPATAERLYVPVLGMTAADGSALATKVWVSNADGIERPVAARFNDTLRTGDERVITARGGGQLLEDLAPAQKAGLIAIDADEDLGISAWMVGRENKSLALAEVPVFGEREIYEAGLEVTLGDLPARRALASLTVGAANLSDKMAFCQANLYGRGESLLGEVPFEVEPMSLARKDAGALAGSGRVEAVRVTCDQSFYPIAVATEKSGLTPIFATGVGPNGSCDVILTLTQAAGGGGVWIAETGAGVFHHATRANPKGIICLKTPKELKIARAVFQWDVKVGPWSKRLRSGLHNLAYYFLDRYRGGVVGNINAGGPNKSIVKFMQNVGMPKGSNTNTKASLELEQGQTYRNVYTFDAANKTASYEISHNFVSLRRLSKEVKPGNNQTLIVKPYGSGNLSGLAMVLEFGNNNGQHLPEVESWEWDYLNFRVTLFPK